MKYVKVFLLFLALFVLFLVAIVLRPIAGIFSLIGKAFSAADMSVLSFLKKLHRNIGVSILSQLEKLLGPK